MENAIALGVTGVALLSWAMNESRRLRKFMLAIAAVQMLATSGETAEALKMLEQLNKTTRV